MCVKAVKTIRIGAPAALWCQTGSKGFIRNTDLDNWCAIGPGTTFWFPSGTGTRISILSYSKITSTTIDDVVPTLDEERTDIERKKAGLPSLKEEEKGAKAHMYVYSYTTPSANTRPRIIIGDDYSYYQWIELGTLAANWVKLNAETEDAARGKIDKIETANKGEGHETNDLPDGGIAFRRALKKMPILGKINKNAVSFYACEQFSDIQIPSLF